MRKEIFNFLQIQVLERSTIIAKFENGEVELIKNRFAELEGMELVKSLQKAFEQYKRREKIKDLLK